MVKIVVVVVVVVAVLAVLAWAVRRRGADEAHSVDGYRHTLDTLQDIRSRSGSRSVRVLGGQGGPGSPPPAGGAAPPASVEGAGPPDRPRSRSDLVFEDQALRADRPGSAQPSRRSEDRAISAMNHRSRRLGLPLLVAVAVVALVAVVAYVGSQHDHHTPKAGSTSATTGARRTTSTTGRSSTSTTSRTSGGGHKSKPASTSTTTTTQPAKYTPVTASATGATYTPPSSTYTVTFTTTTGECWLTVQSSTGTTLLSQTIPAGESKSVSGSGQTVIVVGAPTVLDVTIDHEPVVLPTGYQTPFHITLVPATT